MRFRSHAVLPFGLVCLAVLSSCSHKAEEPTPPAPSTTTSSQQVADSGSFDYQRRHFSSEFFDDSHYKVGQYSTDLLGRPVFIPHNPNGDPFGDVVKHHDELDCNPPETIEAQQQYVHGRYILVSKHDGPGNFSTPVPNGYSKTIAGAIIAASNIASFALEFRDEPALLFLKENADIPALNEVIKAGPTSKTPGPTPIPVASKFKIISCGGDIVTAKLAVPSKTEDADGNIVDSWVVVRIPVRWDDGKWVATMSNQELKNMATEETSIPSDFHNVVFQ